MERAYLREEIGGEGPRGGVLCTIDTACKKHPITIKIWINEMRKARRDDATENESGVKETQEKSRVHIRMRRDPPGGLRRGLWARGDGVYFGVVDSEML